MPLYEVNPATNVCRLVGCGASAWRKPDNTCDPNPLNCITAADFTGVCMAATPGFYVKLDTSIELCSTPDSNCLNCENYTAKCTLCNPNFVWDDDHQKCIFNCPASNQATNPDNNGCYLCSTLDP